MKDREKRILPPRSLQDSYKLLLKLINRPNGVTTQEIIDYSNKKRLFFGVKGVIGVVIDESVAGTVRISDEDEVKFYGIPR
jgi:hypothetical protein